jgi:methylenetetrahydrofolate dehydrogenase (NADP+)/methenyltetrahydrofolate cyclohydrolase
MTARILSGKELAASIRTELKQKIDLLETKPCLAVILVGDNPASRIYVRNKQKAAAEIGMDCRSYLFEASVSQTELSDLIARLNADPQVNGIMIQLPLPDGLDEAAILQAVDPKKDVDGFHPYNIGLLQNNDPRALTAATPKGVIRLLKSVDYDCVGKKALVIGRSKIVGKPVAMLLLNENCTVTIAHRHSLDLPQLAVSADLIVSACGCPEMIRGSWLKDGVAVIDVGINRLNDRLCGDVCFAEALEKASLLTPVPGGVGPMTIAMLLENTLEAYYRQNSNSL